MWRLLRWRPLPRPLAGAAGALSAWATLGRSQPTCAPSEEDFLKGLMTAANLDASTHYARLDTLGLGSVCNMMAHGGGELLKSPPSTASLKEIVKACSVSDEASWGKPDGNAAAKTLYNSCLTSFTTLVAMCQCSHQDALKRVMESAVSTSGHTGVSAADLKERNEWRKNPRPKADELIAAAEALYNCEFACARRCDELTLVNTFIDLLDNRLTVAGLKDNKAYGRHHALMSDADRQGMQDGYVILDTTQKKSEEAKTWRVAQVLSLLNVCIESVTVAAASVTHKPPPGNTYGLVNRGRADGMSCPPNPQPCTLPPH